MQFFVRRPWDLPLHKHTPREVFENQRQHRREFLRSLGISAAGAALAFQISGCAQPTDEEIEKAGAAEPIPAVKPGVFPAPRNAKFEYGRDETLHRAAAEYTNFYEFSTGKDSWRYVAAFKPSPWTLEVSGLCAKPRTFDLDDLFKTFALEERAYRHRCVETWAMCVPWTGFALRALLKLVEPKPEARFLSFETFERRNEAPGFDRAPDLPWPYTEGRHGRSLERAGISGAGHLWGTAPQTARRAGAAGGAVEVRVQERKSQKSRLYRASPPPSGTRSRAVRLRSQRES
jgi:sulfoxide reductase catalytic subunit YedY